MVPTCALFPLLVFGAATYQSLAGDFCTGKGCQFLDDVTDTENANYLLQVSRNATRSHKTVKAHNETKSQSTAKAAATKSSSTKAQPKAESEAYSPSSDAALSKAQLEGNESGYSVEAEIEQDLAKAKSMLKAIANAKKEAKAMAKAKKEAKAIATESSESKAKSKVKAAAAKLSYSKSKSKVRNSTRHLSSKANTETIYSQIQRIQTLAKEKVTQNSTVKAFDCNKYRTPVQVMMDLKQYDAGYMVSELDADKGEYREIWRIPKAKTSPAWSDINACGINPIDSKIYCSIFADGSYIIRLDDSTIEFVAILPWGIMNSGAFGPSGTMYLANNWGKITVAEDLASLPGYTDGVAAKKDKNLLDLRKAPTLRPDGWVRTSDLVAVEYDFEAEGAGAGEYVMSVYGPLLQIVKYDLEAKQFDGSWVKQVSPSRWDNVYGAGWNFMSKLYFASNRGSGVYEIPLSAIDLESDEKITMPKIVGNEASLNNDGFNCMNLGSPFITQILPFDCTANPGPIQLIKVDMDEANFSNWRLPAKEYIVAKANYSTGATTAIYKIPSNLTEPAFVSLNAAGINPMDSIAYGTLKLEWWKSADEPSPFYLVRFDSGKIEFLAKVQGDADAIAGSFDSNGTFWAAAHPHLWKFPGIDRWKGYSNQSHEDLPSYSKKDAILELEDREPVADMVMVFGTFDGGEEAEYILSINQFQQLSLTNIDTAKHTIIPTNKIHFAEDGGGNFGAAWNFNGLVYFSSNDGEGVYKIPLGDVNTVTKEEVTLESVGQSITIHDNDGMNCMHAAAPTHATLEDLKRAK